MLLQDGTTCKRHLEQLQDHPSRWEDTPQISETDSINSDDDVSVMDDGAPTGGSVTDSESAQPTSSEPATNGTLPVSCQTSVRRYPQQDRRPPSRPGFVSYEV